MTFVMIQTYFVFSGVKVRTRWQDTG